MKTNLVKKLLLKYVVADGALDKNVPGDLQETEPEIQVSTDETNVQRNWRKFLTQPPSIPHSRSYQVQSTTKTKKLVSLN